MLQKKRFKKILTVAMTAALLAVSVMPASVFADSANDEGYVYKYIGTDNNNKGNSVSYYDTSAKKNSSSTTVMFKVKKDSYGEVDLAYCCDLDTYTVDNTYYKRTNIENAGYFDSDVAKKIRNVVVNGYDPANPDSINEMKDAANKWAEENNKQSRVNSLSKEEAITATQLAIWTLSNPEMKPTSRSSTITLVKDYLVNLPEHAVSPSETVAESMGISAAVDKDWENNTATVSGKFNFYGELDSHKTKVTPRGETLTLSIGVNGETIISGNLEDMIADGTIKLNQETLDYSYEVENMEAEKISGEVNVDIKVSGMQDLPRGAYFYKTPDRSDSQNFVGIADWDKELALNAATKLTIEEPEEPIEPETPVEPEDPVEPETPKTPEGPTKPEFPETSTGPNIPAEPETPTEPETPAEPEEPVTPETPETPEQPVTPETPEQPQKPEEPASPEEPETPQQPEGPETPAAPETPEEPTEPEVPAEPDSPEMPDTPKTGDDTNMILWGMMAMTSLAIMAVSMLIRRKEGRRF